MGVCMFAIDCLKVNGTHLGTCIDRFYFGSCCLVQPVSEILDNRIETEILDKREPPIRITNTTVKPTRYTEKMSTTVASLIHDMGQHSSTTQSSVATTISKFTTKGTTTTQQTFSANTSKTTKLPSVQNDIPFGQKLTTTKSESTTVPTKISSTEITTVAQKLQTFQVIDGSTLAEATTPHSSTPLTTTRKTTTSRLTTTKVPTVATTSSSKRTTKPIQTKPTPTKTRPTKPTTRKSTTKPKPTKPARE